MQTVVYLIRNSESISKNNLRMISNADSNQLQTEKAFLSVSGEKKAEQLSKHVELQNIDSVYCSTYVKALETAKYIAFENDTVINVDDRLNERKVGNIGNMEWKEFYRLQMKDFNFKLSGGESFSQTKKRMVEAMKNILMFESGNRVAVVSHNIALTCLLSAWCEMGHNYDDEIILSYRDRTIVDGQWTAPMVYKVIFDGTDIMDIQFVNFKE